MVVSTAVSAFQLSAEYRRCVWGGRRLGGDADPIGEAWVVHEANIVADGPFAGRSLAELAVREGPALLGRRAWQRTGERFPLLVKLLDTADWLSVQVHPDDAAAAHLEGAGQWGKAEAWHLIDAAEGAEVIAGARPGTRQDELAAAVRAGAMLELMARQQVRRGDSLVVNPGTIHALGPGLFVYEVQQSSDLTYRVFDWHRPACHGRALHIEQSIAVARADLRAHAAPAPLLPEGGRARLLTSPHFALDLVRPGSSPTLLHTHEQTFHAVTVTRGAAALQGAGWCTDLAELETGIVPAACGAYSISASQPNSLAVVASVP